LGGLAAITWPALVLMRALYDVVIVETVGVGQSETEIADIADTVLFCAQPGSGDALQFMKAGVMEIPHLAVVTKGDMGAAATRAVADLKGALSLAAPGAEDVTVLRCAAATGEGVAELVGALEARMERLRASGALAGGRAAQMRAWARRAVAEAFGAEGLALAAGSLAGAERADSPFAVVSKTSSRLKRALSVGFSQQ
jgi:LAO/AO transport system kinase